jgi:hypothetical protein
MKILHLCSHNLNGDLVHIANSWDIIIYYECFNSFREHQAAHKHAVAHPYITSACKRDDACYGLIFALLAVGCINIV